MVEAELCNRQRPKLGYKRITLLTNPTKKLQKSNSNKRNYRSTTCNFVPRVEDEQKLPQ